MHGGLISVGGSAVGKKSDPEVYPRPDGTVYICGESEYVDVPDDPATIGPREDAIANLQVIARATSSSPL